MVASRRRAWATSGGGGADDLEELEQPQPGLLPLLPRVGAYSLQGASEGRVDIPQGQGGVSTGQGRGQIRGRGVGGCEELVGVLAVQPGHEAHLVAGHLEVVVARVLGDGVGVDLLSGGEVAGLDGLAGGPLDLGLLGLGLSSAGTG